MRRQSNSCLIYPVLKVFVVSSVFFLSHKSLATDANGASFAKESEINKCLSGNSHEIGVGTNVLESLARNVYIIHEKEINTITGETSATFLGKIGLSDTLQGVLIAGLMSGIGMLFRWLFQIKSEDRRSKFMLKQEERKYKRKLLAERKKAYQDFIAFFFLANNWFRIRNDTTMSEAERRKYTDLLSAESVVKAAEINARMRLFASKEIAEAHLKFMEAFKVIYSAVDKDVESRAEDVKKILVMISDAMNKELCQPE